MRQQENECLKQENKKRQSNTPGNHRIPMLAQNRSSGIYGNSMGIANKIRLKWILHPYLNLYHLYSVL